jgi:hypothetical protein
MCEQDILGEVLFFSKVGKLSSIDSEKNGDLLMPVNLPYNF